jgi:hypothetical protein
MRHPGALALNISVIVDAIITIYAKLGPGLRGRDSLPHIPEHSPSRPTEFAAKMKVANHERPSRMVRTVMLMFLACRYTNGSRAAVGARVYMHPKPQVHMTLHFN